MKRFFLLTVLVALVVPQALGQMDSVLKHLEFSGYLEVYYGFDMANPSNHTRPGFMYSYNRHNEFGLNLGLGKVSLAMPRVRANLGLMAGTYVAANLAAEPPALRPVFEANMGYKLSKDADTWLDVGIFPSHIGFESAIGKDCWNLTRSMAADNSPYYETGLKLGHTSRNSRWFLSGLVLNGWQRMSRPDGYNLPAVGHQLTWKPSPNVLLNSSSFIGSDRPDSLRQLRMFHNFYAVMDLSAKWKATVGLDMGLDRGLRSGGITAPWYTAVAMLRWLPSKKLALNLRGEYYRDPEALIISTALPSGAALWGASVNADVAITDALLWRLEMRGFQSQGDFFQTATGATNRYLMMTSSMSVAL